MPRKRRTRPTPAPAPFLPKLEALEDRLLLSGNPTVTNPGMVMGTEGVTASLQIQASDPNSLALTYTATGLPQGLSINAATGLISGRYGYANASGGSSAPTAVVVTASDGVGSGSAAFSWYVMDTDRLPSVGMQASSEGASVSLDLHGTDNSGTNSLTYSESNLPLGLSINPSTGLVSGVVNYRNVPAGSSWVWYTPVVTLTDGHGGTDTRSFSWSVGYSTPLSLGNQSGAEGATVSLYAGTDHSGTAGLTYTETGLPQGLAINPATGLISGVPGYANAASGTTATLTATVTASDGVGAVQSKPVTWTVADTDRLPSATYRNNAEGQTASLDFHGTDNTGTNTLTYSAGTGLPQGLTINPTTGVISGTIGYGNASAGSVANFYPTVTLTDGHGGVDYRGISWGVTDVNRLPTVAWQSGAEGTSVTLDVHGTDSTGTNTLTYSASNLPQGLAINPSTGVIGSVIGYANASGASPNALLYPTVTLTDGHGGTDTRTFSWTVADTDRLPTVATQADAAGQTIAPLDAHGTDNTGTNSLTYSSSNLPAGLTINPSTGVISGTIAASAAPASGNSWYYPTLTLADNHGGTDTRALTWVVSNPSFSWSMSLAPTPSLSMVMWQSTAEGQTASVQATASESSSYALTYSALNLPPGLSINAGTGLITGTVSYGAAEYFGGTYSPLLIVADGAGGSATEGFSWSVTPTTVAPSVTAVAGQSSNRGDAVSLQVQATDPYGNGLDYEATGLPDGLTIDPDTGLISGTVGYYAGEPTADEVTVTVDDGYAAAMRTFAWAVATGANHAPALTSVAAQASAAGDAVDLVFSATDPDSDPLGFSAAGLPAGLGIDPASGEVTGVISSLAAANSTVTLYASDGQAESSLTFLWSVSPVGLQGPSDQTGTVGDTVSLSLAGSDATAGATLTYSATGLPAGLTVNTSTGLISGTLTAAASPTVTLVASDGTNVATQTLSWSVARLALADPADQFSADGASVSLQLQGTDVGGTPTYTAASLPAGLSLNASTGLIAGTVGLAAHGSSPYAVGITLTDGASSDTETFVWAVSPEVALINPGTRQSAAGDTVSLALTGSSGVGTLTYSATGLPAGLSLDAGTGVISGTLGATPSAYLVTLAATDGTATASQAFAWSVSPLLLPTVADQDDLDGDTVSLALGANYHGTATLFYSAVGLPSGLSLNTGTGLISGTVGATADAGGPYKVTASVMAGTVSASQTFEWDVEQRVSFGGDGDQLNVGGDTVSLAISAEDATSGTLTYSATGIPAGLSINASTGLIAGTISASAVSGAPATVTLTVSDGGASATETIAWSVAAVGLAPPAQQGSGKGQAASLALAGRSADGGALTYSAAGLPAGLSVNASTGLISGTPMSMGAYQVGVTASEGTYAATQAFEWDVYQAGLASVADHTSTEGSTVSLALQGYSATGGTLTYSASGLPSGLSINVSTGLISGTLLAGAAAGGPYDVTVLASDGAAIGQQSFAWDVNPVVSISVPADQSGLEGGTVSLAVTATDARGASLIYSARGLPAGLSLNASTGLISGTVATGAAVARPTHDVTLTVSDGTYSDTESFAWSLKPATAPAGPTFTGLGLQGGQAGDEVKLHVQATDAAGYTLSYSADNLPDGLNIDPDTGIIGGVLADEATSPAPYAVTVYADDGVGETASLTFQWAVNPPPMTGSLFASGPLDASGSPVTVAEGTDTGDVTLGSFTTPDLYATEDEYSALVTWGDGSTSEGVVSGDDGTFTMSGDHAYSAAGNYAVSVAVTGPGGLPMTFGGTQVVAPVALTGGFQEGVSVGQGGVLVAEFSYGTGTGDGAGFSAVVQPGVDVNGDGVINSGDDVTGTVVPMGGGLYEVTLPYGYAKAGAYGVTVTLTDPRGAASSASSTVEVGDVYAGVASTLTVATFNVGNSSAVASSYSATIDWGDGTATSAGTVTGSGGVFTVQGTHTYATDSIDQANGVYQVRVELTGGADLVSTKPVVVTRPPMRCQVDNVLEDSNGAVNNQVVASFEVPNTTDTAAEFSATINWGDGTPGTVGTISGNNGLFQITGTHVYTTPGDHGFNVTISQGWFQQKTVMLNEGKVGAKTGKTAGSGIVEQSGNYKQTLVYSEYMTLGGLKLPNFLFTKTKTIKIVNSWSVEALANGSTRIYMAAQAYQVDAVDSVLADTVIENAGGGQVFKIIKAMQANQKTKGIFITSTTVEIAVDQKIAKTPNKITRKDISSLLDYPKHYARIQQMAAKVKAWQRANPQKDLPKTLADEYMQAYYTASAANYLLNVIAPVPPK